MVSGRKLLVLELCNGGSLHTCLQEPEHVHGLLDKDLLLLIDHLGKSPHQGRVYLGEIAPVASAEIAPLSKHTTHNMYYYYYVRQEDYDYAVDSRKILL